ncbi:MAG: hypothetical protein WCQ95_01170 [Bacteroidota bacterium]
MSETIRLEEYHTVGTLCWGGFMRIKVRLLGFRRFMMVLLKRMLV